MPDPHPNTFERALNGGGFNSYSGADIVAQILLPGEGPLTLGELQTISYSIHRENTPVRVIGHVSPVGFVKGPRTVAGSLIFTVFNEYAFYRPRQMRDIMSGNLHPLSDMLPPFDIVLSFVNEFGHLSRMKIFGVSIIDEGGTMSIDDLVTESTFTYMARGIQPLSQYVTPPPVGAITTVTVSDNTTPPPPPGIDGTPFTTPAPQLNGIPTSSPNALPGVSTSTGGGQRRRVF